MIKQFIQYKESKNAIVTIAIGGIYLSEWEKYAKNSWILYCNKNKINLFVIYEDLISKDDSKWKKANWQKLLIGDAFQKNNFDIINVCYLDTDIIISPSARNIFEFYNQNNDKYGLISKINKLPFNVNTTLRKIAFLRNFYYDINYPLDSALFMSTNQVYNYSKLPPMKNYACTGVILFNVEKHSDEMKSWFFKYNKDTISVTDGEQTHLNWEIQNTNKVLWLEYEFQALWFFEMAERYAYLYDRKNITKKQIIDSIRACLMNVDFLHFAGSWHESDMWLHEKIVSKSFVKLIENFENYKKIPVYGKAVGKIVPQK